MYTAAASIADRWAELSDRSPVVAPAIMVALTFIAATITYRIAVRILRRAYYSRAERARLAEERDEMQRQQRQQTIVSLLESLVRYGVFGAAVIASIAFVTGGGVGGVFSAGFLVVGLGFAFQRLLSDVIAGALLLFEGHFSVGDVITVNYQQGVTGIVEDFNLRTTSLRTLGGDRVTLMNGTLQSFTRWSSAQREFRIDFLARGDDVEDRAHELCELELGRTHPRLLLGPHLTLAERPPGTDLARIELRVVVPPMHEHLVDQLEELVAATYGDDLVGGVHSTNVVEPVFDAYRTAVLVRE